MLPDNVHKSKFHNAQKIPYDNQTAKSVMQKKTYIYIHSFKLPHAKTKKKSQATNKSFSNAKVNRMYMHCTLPYAHTA